MRGEQRPSLLHLPRGVASTTGHEAVRLAAGAGLMLDPWQEFVLVNALGERADGLWAAMEVALEVPRQSGKGSILEARSLAGLFLLDEALIIHTAHEFATASEAFVRLESLIRGTPKLHARVASYRKANGEQGIELHSGARIKFRTRTKGAGRGLSPQCVIFDEAMELEEAKLAASLFSVSAQENAQLWFTGSAVDQATMQHGEVFARLRARAIKGEDPALAYFGWSADSLGDAEDFAAHDDPEAWARANPGLGYRIRPEQIEMERRAMSARSFAVERLGVGDWPDPDATVGDGLDLAAWMALEDGASRREGHVTFAVDVRPNRSASSIAVAGRRPDGMWHAEVIEHANGTGWVVDRCVKLTEDHPGSAVLWDKGSPANSLAAQFEERVAGARGLSSAEHAQACGGLFDAIDQRTVFHPASKLLDDAVKGAVKAPLGDAWKWSRRNSAVDISPLVAVTLALHGAMSEQTGREFVFEVF